MKKKIQCPFCFEKFAVEFYPEDGESQDVVYDCEVCCHPIDLKLNWDHELEKFIVDVQKSSGFN
jgi:Cysteine-rich CPXCG